MAREEPEHVPVVADDGLLVREPLVERQLPGGTLDAVGGRRRGKQEQGTDAHRERLQRNLLIGDRGRSPHANRPRGTAVCQDGEQRSRIRRRVTKSPEKLYKMRKPVSRRFSRRDTGRSCGARTRTLTT